MSILLEDLDLRRAELLLCQNALARGGSIMEAAQLLGITRHALKRRMLKYGLGSPREEAATDVTTPREHRPPEHVAPRSAPREGT